jgi:hypothetical protein
MKAMTMSRYAAIVGTMALALATACFSPSVAAAAPDDEAAIRALEDRFAAAFNAGDVNAIMKSYVPNQSLVVFDLVAPREWLDFKLARSRKHMPRTLRNAQISVDT